MSRARLGFLGVGWIGRHRMEAILASGAADAVVIADPSDECLAGARDLAPGAVSASSLDDMLAMDLDGIVIATPSARHAEQSIKALRAGKAVFCQKPLGRNAAEASAVVAAARDADRLLAVDLSYRYTAAMQAIVPLIRNGSLGRIFAIDLVFHNAYGPDKPWFYDRRSAGGGCVMDLGVHLVDLALWATGCSGTNGEASATLLCGGKPVPAAGTAVEDYAAATVQLADGPLVRLTCSWRLHAGQEAEIAATFYGTEGGATMRNVDGSFYNFTAERLVGTQKEVLVVPPDSWGGKAAVAWAQRLAAGSRFDPGAEHLVAVSRVLDAIYQSLHSA